MVTAPPVLAAPDVCAALDVCAVPAFAGGGEDDFELEHAAATSGTAATAVRIVSRVVCATVDRLLVPDARPVPPVHTKRCGPRFTADA
jgi:hypothetical protein